MADKKKLYRALYSPLGDVYGEEGQKPRYKRIEKVLHHMTPHGQAIRPVTFEYELLDNYTAKKRKAAKKKAEKE